MADQSDEFVRPKLEGKRFAGGKMPVEFFTDLLAYTHLVSELAKIIYCGKHGKDRVPKGFGGRYNLVMTGLLDGSAVPVFKRDRDTEAALLKVEQPDEYDEARELVSSVIASTALPQGFPKALLLHFNRFGKSLREGEAIELISPGKTSGPKLDREVRLKLLTLKGETPRYDVCILSGKIRAADVLDHTFTIKLDDESSVYGNFDQPFNLGIRRALLSHENIDVKLIGIGKYTVSGEIEGPIKLQHMTIYEENLSTDLPPFESRLDELQRLEAGWLDGDEGQAVSPGAISWSREVLRSLVTKNNMPSPFIYPTTEGGLQAEWSIGAWEVAAQFDVEAQRILLRASETTSDKYMEDTCSGDVPILVNGVIEFLTQFLNPPGSNEH